MYIPICIYIYICINICIYICACLKDAALTVMPCFAGGFGCERWTQRVRTCRQGPKHVHQLAVSINVRPFCYVGVLTISALLFGVYVRAPDFGKLHFQNMCSGACLLSGEENTVLASLYEGAECHYFGSTFGAADFWNPPHQQQQH